MRFLRLMRGKKNLRNPFSSLRTGTDGLSSQEEAGVSAKETFSMSACFPTHNIEQKRKKNVEISATFLSYFLCLWEGKTVSQPLFD